MRWPTGPSYNASNPNFASATDGGYQLRADSPATDNGQTLAKVTMDGNGNQRPSGHAYDIGAFEFQSAPTMQMAAPIQPRVIE